jgi:hypothetical protein
MRQVLDSFNLRIDRKTYYNFVRSKSLEDEISNNSFKGLVLALEEVGFRFTYAMGDKLAEDGSVKERVLKQLFFISDAQITYGKRFLANEIMLIDSTFKINRLGLVLLVVVRVINTGRNFLTTYSFARSEAKGSFNFIFNSLRRFIFINDITEAQIMLRDQAAGLITLIPKVMPNYKL